MHKLIPSRRRIIVSGVLSVAGGITAVAMFIGLRGAGSRILTGQEIPVVIVAVMGAFIAGIACADAFGRQGRIGWFIAGCGALGATILGALTGGLLLFSSPDEAFFCLVIVAESVLSFPVTGIGWVAVMAATHIVSLVFVPKVPADLDLIPGPDNL